ncbi:MAG: hypothetical protein NVSMB59_22990 [Vulcanimicrobiaceae bacterium]
MRVALGVATTTIVACALAPTATQAQATIRPLPLHAFVRYGLDATLVRVDRVEFVAHVDGRPYVRDHHRIAGADGYLLVRLSVRNPGATPENIPLLQTAFTTDDGRTVDPAVYGPFLEGAVTAAPTSATIAAHATARLTLAIADVPDGHRAASIVFNPNDDTAAYRLRLRASDVTTLPAR